MSNAKVVLVFASVAAIMIVAMFEVRLPDRRERAEPFVKFEMQRLLQGLKLYQIEYDEFPSGNPSEILRALLGKNPHKIVFVDLITNRLNSSGDLLDLWGTPYQIKIESSTNVTVRAAGKNKSFGDDDDVMIGIADTRR